MQRMCDDGFGELNIASQDFHEFDTYSSNDTEQTTTKPEKEVMQRTRDKIHKRGLPVNISTYVGVIKSICNDPKDEEKVRFFLLHFIMLMYGQRNLRKEPISESQLTEKQLTVYRYIREKLANPERRKRIDEFIRHKGNTRRLVNYFTVHYPLKKALSYYLDRRSYPHKIIGRLNDPNQPDIVQLIDQGENIHWTNFHQEYKNSKHKNNNSDMHAPYRRASSVRGSDDGQEYSLCEQNFYIWLDDVGGIELFYMFEEDIRNQKAKDARMKRLKDEHSAIVGKKRKEKIVLRKTDGKNYQNHAIKCDKSASYTALKPVYSLDEFLRACKRPRCVK